MENVREIKSLKTIILTLTYKIANLEINITYKITNFYLVSGLAWLHFFSICKTKISDHTVGKGEYAFSPFLLSLASLKKKLLLLLRILLVFMVVSQQVSK